MVVRFEEGEERFNADAFPEKTRTGDEVRVGRTHHSVLMVSLDD